MERIEPAVKARRVSRNEGSDPASPNGKAVSDSERTELMLSSLRRDSPKPKLRAAGWLKIADENPGTTEAVGHRICHCSIAGLRSHRAALFSSTDAGHAG